MPRRTRPSYRLPPTNGLKPKQPKKKQSDSDELSDEEGRTTEGDSEVDADGPRVAVWEDDDEGFLAEQTPDNNRLENDLPLGALRRAQELLKGAVAESESESGISERRVEWSTKGVDGAGRRNKHGPVETTAKKPVTRRRMVVDVPKSNARDPRFEGRFDAKKFEQSYGFLAERRETEVQVLRESLTKARKMVGSSRRSEREEREREVERLERAVKRSESVVNRDRCARMEQEALGEAKKAGKGKWFLKKSERRELLVRARYTMHAKEGTLHKAIARKLRKTGQNEKRSRPRA